MYILNIRITVKPKIIQTLDIFLGVQDTIVHLCKWEYQNKVHSDILYSNS